MASSGSLSSIEQAAKARLDKNAYTYFAMGAEDEDTLKENELAWRRWKLKPRVLRDVSNVNLTTNILGHKVASPVVIAPVSLLKWAHADGEKAVAAAAAEKNVVLGLSCSATCTLEEVAECNQAGPRFFQLYVYRDREVTRRLVDRAERAGYSAICVTADHAVLGNRERTTAPDFKMPTHLPLANLIQASNDKDSAAVPQSFQQYVNRLYDQSLCWADLKWICGITRLPVLVKGIVSADDAEAAVACGVKGIIVSNHGGRQLDNMVATADVLREVVEAVAGRVEVYVDGGIRRGTDVVKALCLGANGVLIGRPVVWGLASAGKQGVVQVLETLEREIKIAMALMGCRYLSQLSPDFVVRGPDVTSKL